jgi:hypothetical protein
MIKDFDTWNTYKKELEARVYPHIFDDHTKKYLYKEGEI